MNAQLKALGAGACAPFLAHLLALLLTLAGQRASAAVPGAPGCTPLAAPEVGLQCELEEETEWSLPLPEGFRRQPHLSVWAEGLPPGAWLDLGGERLAFRPDFTQGGQGIHSGTLFAQQGSAEPGRYHLKLLVRDTILTPPIRLVNATKEGEYRVFRLEQTTNEWLDSPGYQDKRYDAVVVAPTNAPPKQGWPVRLELHGFSGPLLVTGRPGEVVVRPTDPRNTYWWGYDAALPGANARGESAPDYTARRAIHLLRWALGEGGKQAGLPKVDSTRAYVAGRSMGGAGALALGLLYPQHFTAIESYVGATVARNHRPSRKKQLAGLWGPPNTTQANSPWNRLDTPAALGRDGLAQQQFVFTYHAKDDPIIHFSAAVMPSPATSRSFYNMLQKAGVAHLAVWDEGGHSAPDPALMSDWWPKWWHPKAETTGLRLGAPIIGFSNSTADSHPGKGTCQTGGPDPHPERGCPGNIKTIGDTNWDGDPAGGINLAPRFEQRAARDEPTRFEIPLWAPEGQCNKRGPVRKRPTDPCPSGWEGPWPVRTTATVRRTVRFRPWPNEMVRWTFGELSGETQADATGTVSVPELSLTPKPTMLILIRGAAGTPTRP